MHRESKWQWYILAVISLFAETRCLEVDTELAVLTVEQLDAAQRELAATWEDNKYCNIQADGSVEDLPGFCMAEPAGVFVARSNRKQELVEELVATSLADFTQRAVSAHEPMPSNYSFTMTQRLLNGSMVDHSIVTNEVDGLANDCAQIRGVKVPEGSWSKGHSTRVDDDEAARARQSLVDDGAVLLRGLVSDEALLNDAKRYLLQRAAGVNATSTEYVHGAKHRHHIRLRPDSDPMAARLFKELVRSAATVLLPLVSTLGAVVEFASFLTNPGAAGQGFHSDVGMAFDSMQAPHYSLFWFLADLDDEAHGPLQIAPRSHALSEVRETTRYAVREIIRGGNKETEKLCLSHWKLAPVKAGDAVLYDGTGLHRGTENNSTRTRIVVYMSVMGVGSLAFGPTYAIDESLLKPPTRIGDVLAGDALLSEYLENPHRRRSHGAAENLSRPEL